MKWFMGSLTILVVALFIVFKGFANVRRDHRTSKVQLENLSTATPQVKLENYEFSENKISLGIEVFNVLTEDVRHLFVGVECSTLEGEAIEVYLLLMSENDPVWVNGIRENYDVHHIHLMDNNISVQEKRNINTEVEFTETDKLGVCNGLSVRGYSTSP